MTTELYDAYKKGIGVLDGKPGKIIGSPTRLAVRK
jgi:hypothetical protein